MIPFIGDLSKNDAKVLRLMAEGSSSILEFGVGASTQVLRHYLEGNMISVETMQEWIDRTKLNFQRVGVNGHVKFVGYNEDYSGRYDFIFVDGHKRLRAEFAFNTWRFLKYGGIMAFHDTRRDFHIEYVGDVIKEHFRQIETIEANYLESNITIIKKRKALHYENWNNTEGRPAWMYGRGEFNEQEFEEYKTRMKDL